MTGAELIAAERQRQIDKEGWTEKHDKSEHEDGDLVKAGVCYAILACDINKMWREYFVNMLWPFDSEWWKPKRKLRNLVRAGALIAAEIDLIQARQAKGTTHDE